MTKKRSSTPHVIHVDDVKEIEHTDGTHWGGGYKPLTPALAALPGRLGVNLTRVPPGRSACPFHTHAREDEVFFVLSGRGVFRYGKKLREIGPGDCIACPAGTGVAHQLANPFDTDLVYLAIGNNDPHEVCTYPDSGKVLVRSMHTVGYLKKAPYMDGEPDLPRILSAPRPASRQAPRGGQGASGAALRFLESLAGLKGIGATPPPREARKRAKR